MRVTSNSESHVVAYMKQKDAEERAPIEKMMVAEEMASQQMHEAKKKFLEYGNPQRPDSYE